MHTVCVGLDVKPWSAVVLSSVIGAAGMLAGWWIGARPTTFGEVPVRTVADYLHAVIEADRTFYTQHVVERMEARLVVTASERWREEGALPLPAQFLQEAAESLATRGKPIRYRLVSLWPINPDHAPASDQDARALAKVAEGGVAVEDFVRIDGQRYFRAIYPDRAVSPACISCHNTHPRSPRRDFSMNEVMGGLEILIPVGPAP